MVIVKLITSLMNVRPSTRLIRLIEIIPSMMPSMLSFDLNYYVYPTCILVLEYILSPNPSFILWKNEEQKKKIIAKLVYSVFLGMQKDLSSYYYSDGYYYRSYYVLKQVAKVIDWPFSLQPMIQFLNKIMEEKKIDEKSFENKALVLSFFEIILPFIENNPRNIHLDNPSDLCKLIYKPLSFIQFSSPFALLLQFMKALQNSDLLSRIGNSLVVNILEAMDGESNVYYRWCYLKLIEAIIPYMSNRSTTLTKLWEAYKSILPITESSRYPKST